VGLVVGWATVLAPLTSAVVMGVIGYPMYRRRPGGMAAFERTGIYWWFGTLAVLTALGTMSYPDLFDPQSPAVVDSVTPLAAVGWCAAAVIAALAVEWLDDRLGPESSTATTESFLAVLPPVARSSVGLHTAVAIMAALEELAFRALMLGFLIVVVGTPDALAAVLCAGVFGISHWWYGPRQVGLKTLTGAAFTVTALAGGWVVALVAHVAFNLVVTALSTRHAVSRGAA
jgi:hypothetical protein